MNRDESLPVQNHHPLSLKNGLIPFLWNSLFQLFRGDILEKLCSTPFQIVNLPKFKGGRVHVFLIRGEGLSG